MLLGHATQSRPAASRGPDLTPRVRVTLPGSDLEREADRAGAGASVSPGSRSRASQAVAVPGARAVVDAALSTPGQPVEPVARGLLEKQLGHDFSRVRVHHESAAADSARRLHANAFAVGEHVVFASGRYQPHTPPGRRLLAHELAHVVQQRRDASAPRRFVGGETIGQDDSHTQLAGEMLVQCDFAGPVPQEAPVVRVLTAAELQAAIAFDKLVLKDEAEIRRVRDLVGVPPQPAVIDEDFVNAVVSFQAGQNITQDGKLGPVTASRLGRELKAEAKSLGKPAGNEVAREGRIMDRRALTFSVVNPAHELTTTGSVEYGVRFGVPDPAANGWVIQHVRFAGAKQNGAGNPVALNTVAQEYWEGWQVRHGHVFIGGSADAHVADTFRTVDEGAGTRGTLSVTGRVTFVRDFNLTLPPWGHTVAAAGALPTRTTPPAGWSDGEAALHRMTVRWNDTIAPATHAFTATP